MLTNRLYLGLNEAISKSNIADTLRYISVSSVIELTEKGILTYTITYEFENAYYKIDVSIDDTAAVTYKRVLLLEGAESLPLIDLYATLSENLSTTTPIEYITLKDEDGSYESKIFFHKDGKFVEMTKDEALKHYVQGNTTWLIGDKAGKQHVYTQGVNRELHCFHASLKHYEDNYKHLVDKKVRFFLKVEK